MTTVDFITELFCRIDEEIDVIRQYIVLLLTTEPSIDRVTR